jgi:hypothetical protein
VEVANTCNPLYRSNCQAAEPQLRALAANFKCIVENTTVTAEARYALALNEACYGRIQALFKELDIDLHVGELNPRILGHEVCLHLIVEDITEKLKSLTGSLAEPA